jgi:hypothetical protein
VHVLAAVDIQQPNGFRLTGIRSNCLKGETSDCQQALSHDALLEGQIRVNPFRHENCLAGFLHAGNHALAGAEVGLVQAGSTRVEPGSIGKFAFAQPENAAALRSAEIQYGLDDLTKDAVRGKILAEGVLHVEQVGNLRNGRVR